MAVQTVQAGTGGFRVARPAWDRYAFEDELKKPEVRQKLEAYVQAGGRLYVTDWSYDWLEQVETLSKYIDFEPGQSNEAPEPQNAATLGLGGGEGLGQDRLGGAAQPRSAPAAAQWRCRDFGSRRLSRVTPSVPANTSSSRHSRSAAEPSSPSLILGLINGNNARPGKARAVVRAKNTA